MSHETIDVQAVAIRESADMVRAEDFMPVFTVDQALQKKVMMNQFINKVLRETVEAGGDGDYGMIPGAKKKVLLKPGAEKLCSIFGLAPQYIANTVVEDWTGKDHAGEPLFSYEYRCQLLRGNRFMGEAIGSCNSWESKYRYRWIPEDQAKTRPDFDTLPKRGGKATKFEPDFAIDKAETGGKYGKPAEYWAAFKAAVEAKTAVRVKQKKMGTKNYDGWEITTDETQYRVPNPEVADIINTCQKMAQKRALVAAVLVVTNCSDAFTQDMEDFTPAAHSSPAEVVIEAKAARQVPEALKEIMADFSIDTMPGAFSSVQSMFTREFGEDKGGEAFRRLTADFRSRNPKGSTPLASYREGLLDLYESLEELILERDVPF